MRPSRRCAAGAGPADNQLDDPSSADLLRDRGIFWTPDPIVSAGGIIHATGIELRHLTEEEAMREVERIDEKVRPPAPVPSRPGTAG